MRLSQDKYDVVLVATDSTKLEITLVDKEAKDFNDYVLEDVTIEEYSDGYLRIDGTHTYDDGSKGRVVMSSTIWEI